MNEKLQDATIKILTENSENTEYVVKFYYNNKFIGYLNSFVGGYWSTIRIVDNSDSSYIRKYSTERGASIASKSEYIDVATELLFYRGEQLAFETLFKSAKRDGLDKSLFKAKASLMDNEKVDWSEIEIFKED